MRHIYPLFALLAVSALSLCFWIAYGNPFKEVVFSGASETYDPSRAFFVERCNPQGLCQISAKHRRVLHFSLGDGAQGYPGSIKGRGGNPVARLQKIGFNILPSPDFAVAALKWCSDGQIWQEFRWHGRHFIVELPQDPIATARCVQKQLPRRFDVSIADPLGRYEDRETFAILRGQ